MALTRKQISNIYKPTGAKLLQAGIALPLAAGGNIQLTQSVDLTLPLIGLRFVLEGRDVVAGAGMAAINPEGFLNAISRIVIRGTNSRQKGNVTLYDMSLATRYSMAAMFRSNQANLYHIGVPAPAMVSLAPPTTPFPAAVYNPTGAAATYDFRIVCDFPFYPDECPVALRPMFQMRNEEWGSSVQIQVFFGPQANAAVQGFLGIGAAATTHVFTAFGAVAGAPTLGIYGLPIQMGLELKDTVLPGFVIRTEEPINAILVGAGANVEILRLQKAPTNRVLLKVGTTALAPFFNVLSDVIVTDLGISLGGNRWVRELDPIMVHKASMVERYGCDAFQGYNCLDFLSSGSPDSAFPAGQIGDGSTFSLRANVLAGGATAYGIIVQEQQPYAAEGLLYSF